MINIPIQIVAIETDRLVKKRTKHLKIYTCCHDKVELESKEDAKEFAKIYKECFDEALDKYTPKDNKCL